MRNHRELVASMVGNEAAHQVTLGREPPIEQDIAPKGCDNHVDFIAIQADLAKDHRGCPGWDERTAIVRADETNREKPEAWSAVWNHQEIPLAVKVWSLASCRYCPDTAIQVDRRCRLYCKSRRGKQGGGKDQSRQISHHHSPDQKCHRRSVRLQRWDPATSVNSTSRLFANSLRFFVKAGTMQFTQRQWSFSARLKPFAAAIPLGLLLGFAGPFGSYPAYPTAIRYAFWLGLTLAGVAAVVTANALPAMTRLREGAARIGAVALVSALPMTFVVAWTISLLQPGRVFAPQQLLGLFAAVAPVQLLIAWITGAGAHISAAQPAPTSPEPATEPAPASFPPALLGKLPPEIGSHIVALETEDHYLRVHTTGGSALILMRMADAVALLDPRLGVQVHRRWWVAQTAVAGVRTKGQRLYLCLSDHRLVPVSRSYSAVARARFASQAQA